MPDLSLDPSALTFSQPPTSSSLASKANGTFVQPAQKVAKPSSTVPRIELEPLYTSLKAAISEHWAEYKQAISLFILGQLNQDELAIRTDHFLTTDPAIEHLHNQLIAGVLANVNRDPPEPGVAPFVSANDKPVVISKPVAGDAAEQRLKTEVMQLPARERRRLKDVPEPEVYDPIPASITDQHYARQLRTSEAVPTSAGGKTNWDLEIRKRYAQPLAAETGEFPDAEAIQGRMVPICYEESLPHGCASTCASFMATATEQFIKEVLSAVYNKTRSNMPGGSVNSILTHRFKKQLQIEEDGFSRGVVSKVSGTGLLPIEIKEASVRPALAMHDLKLATDVGDVGLGQFPIPLAKVVHAYEEGEYETYQDLRSRREKALREQEAAEKRRLEKLKAVDADGDVKMNGVDGLNGLNGVNGIMGNANGVANGFQGIAYYEDEDDDDDWGWEGGSSTSRAMLTHSLEECLAVGF